MSLDCSFVRDLVDVSLKEPEYLKPLDLELQL